MITILILLILIYGAYSGYKNGTVIELLKAVGYGIVLIFAFDYYKQLSEFLELIIPYPTVFAPESNPYYFYDANMIFSMDQSYYNIISFGIIFLIGWLIVKFIVRLVSYTLMRLKAPEPFNSIGGAILGFIMNYLGVYFILFFLSTIPLSFIQEGLDNSFAARNMITSTPVVSEQFHDRFIVEVNREAVENQPLMDLTPEEETQSENNNE